MSKVQLVEEAEPALPRNVETEFTRSDYYKISDSDNGSNRHEDGTDVTASSLVASEVNRKPIAQDRSIGKKMSSSFYERINSVATQVVAKVNALFYLMKLAH